MDYETYSKSDLSVRHMLVMDAERRRNKWYRRLGRWCEEHIGKVIGIIIDALIPW